MNTTVSPLLRIEHVALRVTGLEDNIAWYRDVIGLREVDRAAGKIYLAVGDKPTWDISLVEGGTGLEYFAASVADEHTLEALAKSLSDGGLSVTDPEPMPQIQAAIAFQLPGGQWMRAVVPEARHNYTVATEVSFGAVFAPKELHHVTLAFTDLPAVETFMVDHLGMVISDHGHAEAGAPALIAFWRFAENHHDIAGVSAASNGIHHFAFVVSGVGDLVALADRMAACGFANVENGIGRHGAGNNIFLYTRDPTGNIVEFSTDLARITDRSAPYRVWTGPASGNLWGPVHPPDAWLRTVT